MANRCKGFVSFDFLFSIIPILLIVLYTVSQSSFMQVRMDEQLEHQVLFNKLVSISDYVVRAGAAKTEGSMFPAKKIHPNLIASDDFTSLEATLKGHLHLKSLHIGFQSGEGTCIYRLVVYEPDASIRKIYFCGE